MISFEQAYDEFLLGTLSGIILAIVIVILVQLVRTRNKKRKMWILKANRDAWIKEMTAPMTSMSYSEFKKWNDMGL